MRVSPSDRRPKNCDIYAKHEYPRQFFTQFRKIGGFGCLWASLVVYGSKTLCATQVVSIDISMENYLPPISRKLPLVRASECGYPALRVEIHALPSI
jgi:hypothetical protein